MKKTVCAILLAAGSSTRMGMDSEGNHIDKMLLRFNGKTPIELCLDAFTPFVDEIVIAASISTFSFAKKAAEAFSSIPIRIILGGVRRQDSVLNAIAATDCDIVMIHDCARCLVTSRIIVESRDSAIAHGSGVAALKMRDTVRSKEADSVLDRSQLVLAQTPQSFDRLTLLNAYDNFKDVNFTDDASVWKMAGNCVCYTQGGVVNQKLTESNDSELFEQVISGRSKTMRIGYGEDTHRLTESRKLILCGVEIPYRLGLFGHSDADAPTHAIMDALLGAAGLGDIGIHFPDNDPSYLGISSISLAEKVYELLFKSGYIVSNIDATIIAQEPKLSPYREVMRKNIADALHIGINSVSIKFTTPEHTGPEGRLECITARAVCTIVRL